MIPSGIECSAVPQPVNATACPSSFKSGDLKCNRHWIARIWNTWTLRSPYLEHVNPTLAVFGTREPYARRIWNTWTLLSPDLKHVNPTLAVFETREPYARRIWNTWTLRSPYLEHVNPTLAVFGTRTIAVLSAAPLNNTFCLFTEGFDSSVRLVIRILCVSSWNL